jgi:hypothetical protein
MNKKSFYKIKKKEDIKMDIKQHLSTKTQIFYLFFYNKR